MVYKALIVAIYVELRLLSQRNMDSAISASNVFVIIAQRKSFLPEEQEN
jgi:hypothetical protein